MAAAYAGMKLSDVSDRHRGKRHRGTECGKQEQYDGEGEPLLASARRQRRQQDRLLVQRARRSGRGQAGSRVASGAVLSDRAELQVFRPASIAWSMSFISVSLSKGLLRQPKAPASMTRARSRSSGKAVTKMIGLATLRQQRFLQFDAVQARDLQTGDHAGRMV